MELLKKIESTDREVLKAEIQKHWVDRKLKIAFQPLQEDLRPSDTMDESIGEELEKVLSEDSDYQIMGVSPNWFCAKVLVQYRGFESETYLGGCSYKSYQEFQNDAYFVSMVNDCIVDINLQITCKNIETRKAWELRRKYIELGRRQR